MSDGLAQSPYVAARRIRICNPPDACMHARVVHNIIHILIIGGDLAPSLGGRGKNPQTKISGWRIFRKKIPFSRPKFLMTFLVIDHVFQIFPSLFQIFHIFTLWNVIYDPLPFLHEKNPLQHYIYFSKYCGTDAWAVPTSIFVGGSSLSPL